MAKFSKRIQIQLRSTERDSTGYPLDEWTTVVTVWAGKKDISGREYLSANAEHGEVTTKWEIRMREGITNAMRIVHGSDIYDIKAVLEESSRVLRLMCARHT